MNTAQRTIKYLAMAFAIFLTVAIFSGIVYGVLGIVTAGKLVGDNSTVATKCVDNEENFCLEIALSISNLEVKKGDKLSVDTKNEKVEVVQDDHNLIITEKGRHIFERFNDREVIVYIPEDMEFSKVGISGGVGSIYVENLRTKDLEMALGIGETKIESLEVENANISTGIGEVSVGLKSKAEDYTISTEKGIGEITLNGKSIPDHSTRGEGSKKVEIKGGIGAINITTND
ncbi:DUF4097 family beta strand repeat protein [Candidatus Saccharibacteria bacterium]|nr:DUF4097 family beta strand repeat protein [Candidatus Saccharibacteria bacterium]